jgi:hypothetical protein
VLAGAGFANADRLKRFLEFTVEMKLRGEEGQIKEFLLGQEVFDRGAGYDPRLDPIVRVEARRLRQRLAEYYSGPGQDDPLRIEFPKGSYAPVIHTAAARNDDPGVSRRGWWKAVAGLAGTAALLAAVLPLFRPRAGQPWLAVVPAHWVWGDAAALDTVDESLAEEVTASLARDGTVAVAAWPVVIRSR